MKLTPRFAVRTAAVTGLLAGSLLFTPLHSEAAQHLHTFFKPTEYGCGSGTTDFYGNGTYVGTAFHADYCGDRASVDVYYEPGYGTSPYDYLKAILWRSNYCCPGDARSGFSEQGPEVTTYSSSTSTGYRSVPCGYVYHGDGELWQSGGGQYPDIRRDGPVQAPSGFDIQIC